MMEILNGATDNQIAVLGGVVALVGSMGLMMLTGAVFSPRANQSSTRRRPGRIQGQVDRPVQARTSSDQEAA